MTICIRCKERETEAPIGFIAPICKVCHTDHSVTAEELQASVEASLIEAEAKATQTGTVACPLCGAFVETILDGGVAFCTSHPSDAMTAFMLEHRDYLQIPVDIKDKARPS